MRSSHQKTISLLMLIIFFVMGLGAYGFNSKWLAHELDHDRDALAASADHDHASQLNAQGNPGAEPLSDSEHKLLHDLDPIEPFPSLAWDGLGELPARMDPLRSLLPALLPAELDSPFRPPRSIALT